MYVSCVVSLDYSIVLLCPETSPRVKGFFCLELATGYKDYFRGEEHEAWRGGKVAGECPETRHEVKGFIVRLLKRDNAHLQEQLNSDTAADWSKRLYILVSPAFECQKSRTRPGPQGHRLPS